MTNQVETEISWEDLKVADESAQIYQDPCEEITEWEEGNEPVPTRCKCHVKSEMDSLTIDWIPELIEEVIVDWHRPRMERWYIMPGLGSLAEQMHRDIQQEIERRSLDDLIPADLGAVAVEGYFSGFDPGTSDFTRMLEITRDAEIANTTLNDFRGLRAAIRDLVDSVMASFDTFFKACLLLFEVRVLCVWDEFVWKMKRRTRKNSAVIQSHPYSEFLLHYEINLRPEFDQSWPSGILDLGSLTEEKLEVFRTQWNSRCNRMLAFCTPSRLGLTGRQ